MPVFDYKALNSGGEQVTGIIDADSSADARAKLRRQGDLSDRGPGVGREG